MRRLVAVAVALAMPLALVSGALPGCKPKVVAIAAVRDALASAEPNAAAEAMRTLPSCPDSPPVAIAPGQPSPLDKGCLSEIATAFGSRSGFNPSPPDQAALATVAVLVARDGRADRAAHADLWLGALKGGKGVGADALRAAVSRSMEQAATTVGRRIEGEAASREVLRAVAAALPGACPTYALLGRGEDPAKLPPELGPDHAACVQKDLSRREGPGASYGAGIARALEGSLALWRETERALRLGAPAADPTLEPRIAARLAVIEAATQKIATEKLTATVAPETLGRMGELHAQAGILLWRDAGAGDGGAAEAGIPKGIPVMVPPSAAPKSTTTQGQKR